MTPMLNVSEFLRNHPVELVSFFKNWKEEKIRNLKGRITHLTRRQDVTLSETFDESFTSAEPEQSYTEWFAMGWENDVYVEHDEDFSELFNSTSPNHETMRAIQRLKG